MRRRFLKKRQGRVGPESLINGIPAIVSHRGGLSEMLHGGGFVLPIPADVTPMSKLPPGPAAVEPWLELVFRLADDEAFYQDASARAVLAPRYVDFFEAVLRGGSEPSTTDSSGVRRRSD